MIVEANAVSDPRAVVVHARDASKTANNAKSKKKSVSSSSIAIEASSGAKIV